MYPLELNEGDSAWAFIIPESLIILLFPAQILFGGLGLLELGKHIGVE